MRGVRLSFLQHKEMEFLKTASLHETEGFNTCFENHPLKKNREENASSSHIPSTRELMVSFE